MRLLLDANLSGKRIGEPLRAAGHDFRALQEERELDGLDDPHVLELAATEERILVTRNCRDFAPLLRAWASEGRSHAGCVLIWSLGHHEFGLIVAGLERLLTQRPRRADWIDLTLAL